MKITLEPTPEIVRIHGMQGNTEARIWVGHDEHGAPVRAYVNLVSPETHDPVANERFANALREVGVDRRPPAYDLRYFVDRGRATPSRPREPPEALQRPPLRR